MINGGRTNRSRGLPLAEMSVANANTREWPWKGHRRPGERERALKINRRWIVEAPPFIATFAQN